MVKLKKKIDIIYYLILLIPIFSVLSIFLLEFILIIISFCFLKEIFEKKKWYLFNNIYFKFFIIFYLYILINFIIQTKNFDTLSIIFYFRYFIYILSIFYFLHERKKLFYDFLKTIIFLIIFLSIDSIFQFIFEYNLIGLKQIVPFRVSSFFGNELILGSFILRMLPFIFMVFLIKKKFLNNKVKFLSLILGLITIFLSGERVAIFLTVLTLIVYFVLSFKIKEFKFIRIFFIFFFIFTFLILLFSKDYHQRIIKQATDDMSLDYQITKDLLNGYDKKPNLIFFSGLHHNLMITSMRVFKDNIIFGSGPRTYRHVCKDYKINIYSCDRHPHNFFFQILAETGIVGFFFLIFVYFIVTKKLFSIKSKLNYKSKLQVCILIHYFTSLWPLIPSGNFFNNWLSILIFLPLAFYFYLENPNEFKRK